MVAYTYSRVSALNFNTTPPTVARSATGSVYAIADTTFTTPLNVTMVVGGVVTTSLSTGTTGHFPDFTVADRTSVVWKQAGVAFSTVLTTTDPIAGPKGDPGPPGAAAPPSDLIADPSNPGFYFMADTSPIQADPLNPGLYTF